MPIANKTITPCLWFDTQTEEAAKFYCSTMAKLDLTTLDRAFAGKTA